MKHEDISTKASGKRGTGIVTALAAALLCLFMTAAPALAAPTTTAQASSHSLTADVSAQASIQAQLCGPSTTHWVHVYMNTVAWCYGGAGTWNFGFNNTWDVCSGNNIGTLKYYDPTTGQTNTWGFTFEDSNDFGHDVQVISLTISTWYGSYTGCL
jgi:hypothetical protein